MDCKMLSRDLAAVNRIMDSWLNGTPVSAMDKDIALEKLRRIYEEVGSAGCGEFATEEVSGRVETFAHTEQETVVEPTPVPEPASIADPGELSTDNIIAEIDAATQSADEDAACESVADAGRAKIDRRALLSLYDDPYEAATPVIDPVVDPVRERGGEIKPAPVPVASIPKEPVKVWGEVNGNGSRTIADTYACDVHDVASELSGSCVESLRRAIGVNDRFRMVRDMFDSDTEAYERAIERFERFTDLDDAMVYMYENFSWNPDDESVKMLVDLLTRKLS